VSAIRPGGVGADTIILVGHARLPQSLSSVDTSVILVELEVESVGDLIVDLEISGALPTAARLLTSLLVGKSMEGDFGSALQEFQRRYVGPPQRAIATALNGARESYHRYVRQRRLGPFSVDRFGPP
jgi:hypothetical protein